MKFHFFIVVALQIISLVTYGQEVKSSCVPADEEAQSWPVTGIYLHGLHKPDGDDTKNFRQLELSNRKYLEEVAKKNKIRIALPVSSLLSKGSAKLPYAKGMRSWTGYDLARVEQEAKAACGNAPLSSKRVLIGFSNGGYAARNLGSKNCDSLSNYSSILVIGAGGTEGVGRCGKLKTFPPHVFPGKVDLGAEFKSFAQPSKPEEESRDKSESLMVN